VVETIGEASVEMSTGLTRTILFFHRNSIEIIMTGLCDAKEISRGSIADFRTAMLDSVACLYDEEASACDFYNVYM